MFLKTDQVRFWTLKEGSISITDVSVSTLTKHWAWLLIAITFYLGLFSYYYPCLPAVEDEIGFINQAIVWSKGAVSVEGAGFRWLRDGVEFQGQHVFWRNPGRSLVIFPFLIFGGQSSIFISGALIHVLLTIAAGFILARLKVSPLYALLILCHPTLALYSRTIMGDTLAALCILLALCALLTLKHPGKWIGWALGCAALARYQLGLLLPIMSLLIWKDEHVKRPKREALHCFVAGGAIGLGIAIYNQWLYGNVLGMTKQGYFDLSFVLRNGKFYLMALLLLWPGMLLLIMFDNSRLKKYLWFLSLPVLVLFLPYYYLDTGTSFIQTTVLGLRLVQPVLPLLILSYILVLDKRILPGLRERFPTGITKTATIGICVVLLASQVILFRKHQEHLLKYKTMRDWLSVQIPADSLIIAHGGLGKLFGVPAPGLPAYRWENADYLGTPLDCSAAIQAEKKSWFLASLPKFGAGDFPAYFQDYLAKYRLTRIDNGAQGVILFKCEIID